MRVVLFVFSFVVVVCCGCCTVVVVLGLFVACRLLAFVHYCRLLAAVDVRCYDRVVACCEYVGCWYVFDCFVVCVLSFGVVGCCLLYTVVCLVGGFRCQCLFCY